MATHVVWYPSVEDVIDANILSLDLSYDKHPPRLLGSRKGIQDKDVEEIKRWIELGRST